MAQKLLLWTTLLVQCRAWYINYHLLVGSVSVAVPTLMLTLQQLAEPRAETLFFSNVANLMNFQPSRVFVEYHHQFPPISSENRFFWLALEIRIDKHRNYHKRVEFVWYSERILFCLLSLAISDLGVVVITIILCLLSPMTEKIQISNLSWYILLNI